jgi:hypothetical protein
VTAAKIDIEVRDGNLTVGGLTGGEQLLARGTLQYLESQGLPTRSVGTENGQARLTMRSGGGGQPWFNLPWAACNGATEWQVQINPNVRSDIAANSGGGNVKLNLTGMAVTRLSADTGGGNMEVVLPENATNLDVTARTGGGNVSVEVGRGTHGTGVINASSGAGNVAVLIPSGIAARIHASTGVGQVVVNPSFTRVDANSYESPDYDNAMGRVEITVSSSAGDVSVDTK